MTKTIYPIFLLATLAIGLGITPIPVKAALSMASPAPVEALPLPDKNGIEKIDWSSNIVHIALQVEKELHEDYILCDLDRGMVTMRDNVDLLERIFAKAEERIPVKESYSKEEVTDIVVSLHGLLEEEGFSYREFSSEGYHFHGAHLFGYGLAKREIDCVSYGMLGLGIAEHLGLPVAAIKMPGHFALRWLLGGDNHINLELSIPAVCNDDFYRTWKEISPEAQAGGVYLRNLTRHEVIAEQFFSLSLVWERRKKPDRSLTALNKALFLCARFPDAYNLRGIVWKTMGEMRKALRDFDTAILLDGLFPEARFNRINALLKVCF